MSETVKFTKVVSESVLNNKPIINGMLYFCKDTKRIFLDSNNTRSVLIGHKITVSDEILKIE